MDRNAIHDRAAGCVLGLALGDALGAPYEGGVLGTVVTGLYRLWRGEPLSYTDDAEMMIGLVESLLHDPSVDPEFLAARFAENYTVGRGYGHGTGRFLSEVKRGRPWREANRSAFPEGSLGNGGAMRAAPVGPLHAHDPSVLRAVAERQAEVTHAHRVGMEGAVVVAYAAAMAFREPEAGGAAVLESLEQYTVVPVYREKFQTALALMSDEHSPRRVARALGSGVMALHSAPTAVYLSARFPEDYDAAVSAAIELGGDTDTIAAMTGAIVGARIGKSRLPADALAKLEGVEQLDTLADRYADLVVSRPYPRPTV